MVSGAPDVQLNTPPNCHCSTIRVTKFGPPLRKRRFGPNGSSYVPLLRIEFVRWKSRRVLLSERFLGLRYVTPPSSLASPSVLLHVYDVWFVNPFDNRFVTCKFRA